MAKYSNNYTIENAVAACQIKKDVINIWIKTDLPYNVEEAVVGHELGHVYQYFNGYPEMSCPGTQDGRPVSQQLAQLCSEMMSLVLDPGADKWSKEHGFKLEEAMQSRSTAIGLSVAVANYKPDGYEASNWEEFDDALTMLYIHLPEYVFGNETAPSLPPEINTLFAAGLFASSKLRREPYGLYKEPSENWSSEFPVAINKGLSFATIIEETGTDTPEECKQAMINVINYLHMPLGLLAVYDPITKKVLYPPSMKPTPKK